LAVIIRQAAIANPGNVKCKKVKESVSAPIVVEVKEL
jgi:hypothetical protein